MDGQELIEKYSPFLKQNWPSLVLGVFGMILFVYGLIALLGSTSSKGIVFEKGSEGLTEATGSAVSKEIVVDIEGAVVSPGVYHLSLNSRVKDLLIAASGLSQIADRNWVAKNLNLAAKLSDGGKVYIPFQGEKVQVSGVYSGSATSSSLNINTASEKDLDSLPGIGPSTAQKIIVGRPYGGVEELVSKKIVSGSVFEKIKDRITVY